MKRPHYLGPPAKIAATSLCLNCDRPLDLASVIDTDPGAAAAPSVGDITACIACGHLMGFTEDLRLRALTDDEMALAAGDERLLALQWARGKVFKP